jgi:hypothetical protein
MSDHKEGAARRRDERHTAVSIRAPGGSRKNTKRWCRGVTGREHVPVGKLDSRLGSLKIKWYNHECKNCGRIMAYWIDWPKLKSREPPEWVKSVRKYETNEKDNDINDG